MTIGTVIDLSQKSMFLALQIAGPPLIVGMVVGIFISIFQTVTSINEMTLTFVPKIVFVMLALLMFGPWMLQVVLSFMSNLFLNLAAYSK